MDKVITEKLLVPFIEKLADKLGTTVEKLWGVLLKQAPISGTIDLVICIILILTSIRLFRFVQKKTSIILSPDKYSDGYYLRADWENEGKTMAWIATGVILCSVAVIVINSTYSVIAAFLNPEYWVLEKILSSK